jgi:hypothetical protein
MASALFSVNRKYQSPTVTNEIKTTTYPATAAARAKKYGNGSENKKGPEREEGKNSKSNQAKPRREIATGISYEASFLGIFYHFPYLVFRFL